MESKEMIPFLLYKMIDCGFWELGEINQTRCVLDVLIRTERALKLILPSSPLILRF